MKKVGILNIATGKYHIYVKPLHDSIDKYLLKDCDCSVTKFVFSENDLGTKGSVWFRIDHQQWPYPTLLRFRHFSNQCDALREMDYLFYCDVDMLFCQAVGKEILGDLVGTIHPGFYNKASSEYTYERNPKSLAYIPNGHGVRYYAGGFNGGRAENFLGMARTLSDNIERDLGQGIVAKWHDESHLNRYMIDHPPTVELDPSYCFPESWKHLPFQPRLLALDKDHALMRA